MVGGAELHVRSLVDELRQRGYEAERVTVPFRPQAKPELLAQAAAWRLLDLSSSNGQPIDLLIATRFPSYFARHPRKVAWVIHQHRAAYELCGTEYSDFRHSDIDVGIRKRIIELDREMLGECRHVFTNARNTAQRLETFNGVKAEPLYHPPPLAGQLRSGAYGAYMLMVGRLEAVKRPDLAIRSMAHAPAHIRLIVVGDGSKRRQTEQLAHDLGLGARVDFVGAVDGAALIDLYANALGVIYAPFDEDYGYVTLEAFLSHKPVVTCSDSGGTLEFVADGQNGFVCAPDAAAIGQAVTRLAANSSLAQTLGDAGFSRAAAVTWDGVVERLIG